MKENNLKELIKGKFASQAECARELNWSRQKLSYIVNGQRLPSLSDASELARVLGVTVDALSEKVLFGKSHK